MMAQPNTPPRLHDALAQAALLGVARLDAELLLAHLLQRPRAWLLAHDDEALSPRHATAWQALLAQRADGVPLAYLTGHHEFHGLDLGVSPAVLDPRPDTETLVDWALELGVADDAAVLDLGTGSGAIALALKSRRPGWSLSATDRSAAALAVARSNGERLRLPVDWLAGDWWQAVPARRFDLVVSNPPYIAAGDPHLAALRHEPGEALVSGPHGLDALAAIIRGAGAHLHPGAWLLLEHGHDQAEAVQALLHAAGFSAIGSRADLSGTPRCSGGRFPR